MNGRRSTGTAGAAADESGIIQALGPGDLSLAASVGKYRFLGALGHGGMADVYLAVADGPEGFRKLCVVKMLKDEMANDDDFRAMFVDEARLAARLSHPNIVQTYEVESVNGHLLLAMEYVEGPTMARVRRRMQDGSFPLEASVRVLCDVLGALSYAHGVTGSDGRSLEIVHRDVSPHNIIVGYNGNVKLLDFGIAKSTAAIQATQAGVLKGKIGYMAPEQASFANVDHRADLFSVGVILWEAIAGRRLADGTSSHASLVRRVEGGEPRIEEIVPGVDPELAQIVNHALENQPDDRYANADDFQADLEGWLELRPELPRRVWTANITAAFDEERRKFQALASLGTSEHADGPSLSRVPVAPAALPALATTPPDAVPELPPQASMPSPVLTAPPLAARIAPRRSLPLTIVLCVVGAVAVGLVAYVATSKSSVTPTPVPSARATSGTPADSVAALPGAASPVNVPTGANERPTTAEAPSAPEPAPVNPGRNRRPLPGVPPPPAVTHSARPLASVPEAPRPSASGARPLDERDPYAP